MTVAHARTAAALTAALLLGACRTQRAPVPVLSQRAELAALVGEWVGEYASRESGRSGSIVFTLQAGADTAYGDVVMTPRGATQPLRPLDRAGEAAAAAGDPERAAQTLTIRFVRLESGAVSGRLVPYRDPATGETMTTVFQGMLDGDSIRGSYRSTTPGLPRPITGEWWATRRPAE